MSTDQNQRQIRNYGKYISLIFFLSDFFVLNLAVLISLKVWPTMGDISNFSGSRLMWLIANIALFPMFYFQRQYVGEMRAIQMEKVIPDVFFTVGIHLAIFLPLMIFVKMLDKDSYKLFGWFYIYFFVFLLICRISSRLLLKHFRRKGRNIVKVVIVGTGSTAKRLHEAMAQDEGFGYKICGFFDEKSGYIDNNLYIGKIDKLENFVEENKIHHIYFTLSGEHESLSYVTKIADTHVSELYFVPQLSRYFSRKFQLTNIGPVPVLSTMRNPLKSFSNRMIKRGFDLTVSGMFLIFYPLIYIPVAIAIKMSSPGPVYFRQKRTGYMGKEFDCLKFRTMRVNNESDNRQATADDPRKTRLGAFLRKTSLDELPQFINVFKGEMSVVGPRPHMLKHTEEYSNLIGNYMVRHAVKPGITGWAQVNGYRGITDELWKMQKRVECDVWYIEHWTLLLDVKIMFRTIWNAFHGEKNAF